MRLSHSMEHMFANIAPNLGFVEVLSYLLLGFRSLQTHEKIPRFPLKTKLKQSKTIYLQTPGGTSACRKRVYSSESTPGESKYIPQTTLCPRDCEERERALCSREFERQNDLGPRGSLLAPLFCFLWLSSFTQQEIASGVSSSKTRTLWINIRIRTWPHTEELGRTESGWDFFLQVFVLLSFASSASAAHLIYLTTSPLSPSVFVFLWLAYSHFIVCALSWVNKYEILLKTSCQVASAVSTQPKEKENYIWKSRNTLK